MLNLRNEDIEFIKKNIGANSELLKMDNKRSFLIALDDWINLNGFDDYDYNQLGRTAQKIYDYVYYNL